MSSARYGNAGVRSPTGAPPGPDRYLAEEQHFFVVLNCKANAPAILFAAIDKTTPPPATAKPFQSHAVLIASFVSSAPRIFQLPVNVFHSNKIMLEF